MKNDKLQSYSLKRFRKNCTVLYFLSISKTTTLQDYVWTINFL